MIHFSKVREAYRSGDVEQVGNARRGLRVYSHPGLAGVDIGSTEVSEVPTLEVCRGDWIPLRSPCTLFPLEWTSQDRRGDANEERLG